MCVTNTANRRPDAVSLAPNVVNDAVLLQQQLLGNFFSGAADTTSTAFPKNAGFDTFDTGLGADFENQFDSSDSDDASRPKRRRKPQKPGKTAKMNDRHFVVHNYHDHACDPDENDNVEVHSDERRRGGVSVAFPVKLHLVLDQVEADGLGHIVSWQPHGRCFVVHKPKEFVDLVMPKYFRQTKLTSFQRQLNLYGFCRLTKGPDASGYYHELFLRGKKSLCKKMVRTKVKGTKFKAASSPENEPDFYKMPPVVYNAPSSLNPFDETSDDSLFLCEMNVKQFDPAPLVQEQQMKDLEQFQMHNQFSAMRESSFGFSPVAIQENVAASSQQTYADRVLDEAVDELFFDDGNEGSSLDDLRAWDLSNTFGDNAELEDAQLGMLLEKLLEE